MRNEAQPLAATEKVQAQTYQPSIALLLFVLSMCTLALEIVQVRIFSYSINPVFVYMVVSLALLGIGASGTVLSLAPSLREIPLERALAVCMMLFAGTAALAFFAFSRLSYLIVADSGLTLFSPVMPIFLLFTVPYFFSGLGIALVLVSDSRNVGRNYFVNLVGSGAGCFIVYPFLRDFGAPAVVLAALLPCALIGSFVCWRVAKSWLPLGALVSLVLLTGLVTADRTLPFAPDRSDFYHLLRDGLTKNSGDEIKTEFHFAEWDPVGKIEIVEFPEPYGLFGEKIPALFFLQDAGAPSFLLNLRAHPEGHAILSQGTFYGLATSLKEGPNVLVMGLGGAPDLLASLAAGASHVTGVEINQAVIDALGRDFRAYLDLPSASSGRLEFVHSDGRAFARRSTETFDIIQMTGADTYAAGAVSGSILSENFLYTIEAFRDYFQALRPDGLLAVTRFGYEPAKVVTTAIKALEEEGIERPISHIIVVRQGFLTTLTLIKKSPFTQAEIARVQQFCLRAAKQSFNVSLPLYDFAGFGLSGGPRMAHFPGEVKSEQPAASTPEALMSGVMQAAQTNRLDAWIEEQEEFDLTPSTDDRPFFLQMSRTSWPTLADLFSANELTNPLAWSLNRYISIVVQISLVALALILGPLIAFRRRGLNLAASLPIAAFFFSIGAGFMFIEIGLMQRFGLFLGHPNFSISTILFSLLFFSGVGSWLSGRWNLNLATTLSLAIGSIGGIVLLLARFSGPLFELFLNYSIESRIAIAVLMLAPLSFFMGMPLPNLLKLVEERRPEFAPWALGVNGFASVMGSLATIPLTVAIGFTATLQLGAACYGVAWLCFFLVQKMTVR